MSSCTICFTSGHNRRNCPLLTRNIDQYTHDSLPSYADDLTINENNIMQTQNIIQPTRIQTNNNRIQEINYLNQLEVRLERQEELNRMHQTHYGNIIYRMLYNNGISNEDYIPFETPKCKFKTSNLKNEIKENFDCPICYETINISITNKYCQFSCEHMFCNSCVKLQTEKNTKISCALCRKNIRTIYTNDKETFV